MPPSSNRNAALAANIERERAALQRERADIANDRQALAQERSALDQAKREFAEIVGEFLEHVDAVKGAAGPAPESSALEPQEFRLPPAIVLKEPFGYTENGSLKHWQAGKAITNPEDIALLFALRAPIEGYDHE